MTAHKNDSAATAVIILNWKRPQNIGRIVRTAHEALPDAEIFVIDQAEEADRLAGRDDVPFELCQLRPQANVGPAARFALAAELPFDRYLCIDDDIFLTVDQVRGLMTRLGEEPNKAHGINGQLVTLYADGNSLLTFGVTGEVTTLNQVYAFTRERVQAMLSLAATLGYRRHEEFTRVDDILLSCAGPSRSHDLGPVEACATNNEPGIAVRRSRGFRAERRDLRIRLRGLGMLHFKRSSDPLDLTGLVPPP